ncbi:MAG TPA: dTDP-4-dehydrorhamnose 3,5-epimerase [Pseudolabrys sp.]|nr:dTDP-4-dehydrorhamnose 3,5-epimerase [Pseudolabrys sp.]
MSIEVRRLAIPDIVVLTPKRHADERGFFAETYSKRTLADAGFDLEFVQDNLSHSRRAGTLRGLHYQAPPFAQTKLVQVIRGRILDVAVDIRRASTSFGEHVTAELSAENGEQILVPVGFAHGFCTLEPDTVVTYKVTNYYSAAHDLGIYWNDPTLKINWPFKAEDVEISLKDSKQPLMKNIERLF